MRFVVAFVIALGFAGSARADSGSASGSQALPTDVVEPTKKVNPTELMRERQKIEEAGGGGRSGFWTSRQPAQGGAYRWRLLGVGICLIGLMGGAIVLMIKRANRSNAARHDRWTKEPSEQRDDREKTKPESEKLPSDTSSTG